MLAGVVPAVDLLGADLLLGLGDVVELDHRHAGAEAQHHAAQPVDRLALLVHDVVVLEHVLADVVVVGLDLLLGPLDRPGEHAVLDLLPLLHAQRLHELGDALGGEDAHQVVFQRQEEDRGARVALAAGAAAQLVVDAPGLVALGAHDVEAAGGHHLVVLPGGLDLELLDARGEPRRPLDLAGLEGLLGPRPPWGRRAPGRPRAWPSSPGCRRGGCRCRGRPCWWRW